MKKISFIGALIGVAILGVLSMQASVQAGWTSDMKSGETVTLAKDQTHEGSLYVGANDVKIEGTVTGSLYCAGQNVTITGDVSGDIACGAQMIDYSGTARGSVRLAAQQVTMNGTAGADTTIFAQMATVGTKASLAGDLNGATQSLVLNGDVAKNFQFGAQSLTLNGAIDGSANVSVGTLSFGDEATVAGSLHYAADTDLAIDEAKVGGVVEYNAIESAENEANPLAGLLSIAAMLVVTSLIVAFIAPRFMERSIIIAKDNFAQTLLIGSAAVFVTPIVALLLLISLVGAPLAVVILLLYVAMLMLSSVFLAYYLGATLLRSNQNVITRMFGGSVVLLALWIIPIVNVFAVLATIIVGSGILLRSVTNGYRTPRYSLHPEPPVPPMPTALGGDDSESPQQIAKKPSKTSKKPTNKKS